MAVRVCYLSSVLNVHDQRFLSQLVARGYDTHLVTYRVGAIPEPITRIAGLSIVHREPSRFPRLQKYLFAFKQRDFRRVLATLRPDILHSGYVWKDGFLAALSGFRPHLSMPWGSDILIQAQQWGICRAITRYALRSADMITCDCEEVADRIVELVGYPRDRIVLFPWGVELQRFSPSARPSPLREALGWEGCTVLLMNRTFAPIYDVPALIAALPAIVRRDPDVRVLLVGSGPQERRIRTLVERTGLQEFVHFCGWVALEDMPNYLRAADLYVSTSRSDGSSLSLIEAMACGLPVVVTDVPANLEWVDHGHNGLVVRRGDPAALVKAISSLTEDLDLRRRMGERNVRIARERADWDKNFGKLETMYRTLMAEVRLASSQVEA